MEQLRWLGTGRFYALHRTREPSRSGPALEAIEVAFRGADLDAQHHRGRRSAMYPAQEFVHLRLRALHDRLDAAVVPVAHPSRDAEAQRRALMPSRKPTPWTRPRMERWRVVSAGIGFQASGVRLQALGVRR